MEYTDILNYIKEFGLLPVILAGAILYLMRNKDKIFKTMADQISLFLRNDREKFLQQMDNDLLIKDIHILKLYLMNEAHGVFSSVMSLYDKYKDNLKDSIEELKKDLSSYFKKSHVIEEINQYKIRPEIIQHYHQDIRKDLIDHFTQRFLETLSHNGNSNMDMFKALIRDLLDNYVNAAVDHMEKKFLYSKL
ncbi:MAG: hypothetical protein OEZ36_05255 [Spirochaetota bacterium]|nr:hypothetical protein [Spirochaetota bacterium]